jgi:hypothetical protein
MGQSVRIPLEVIIMQRLRIFNCAIVHKQWIKVVIEKQFQFVKMSVKSSVRAMLNQHKIVSICGNLN